MASRTAPIDGHGESWQSIPCELLNQILVIAYSTVQENSFLDADC